MPDEKHSASDAAQSADYVDDLFDYDVGLDGIHTEDVIHGATAPTPSAPLNNPGVVLGLDEEVKVAKKRQPVARLDENRLLTQAGIPKLRRSARKNLKFKGRGHEFSDLACLLNFYQLWLDDLFPRAKFTDGLAIIERIGHSKRIQTMRRAWVDEDKPKPIDGDATATSNYRKICGREPTAEPDSSPRPPKHLGVADEDLFMPGSNDHGQSDDDFELDALLIEQESREGNSAELIAPSGQHRPLDDGMDELDALLREHEATGL